MKAKKQHRELRLKQATQIIMNYLIQEGLLHTTDPEMVTLLQTALIQPKKAAPIRPLVPVRISDAPLYESSS